MIGQGGRKERDGRQARRDEAGELGDVLEDVGPHRLEDGAAGDLRFECRAVALIERDDLRVLTVEQAFPGDDAVVVTGRGIRHREREDAAERGAAGDDAGPRMEHLDLRSGRRRCPPPWTGGSRSP